MNRYIKLTLLLFFTIVMSNCSSNGDKADAYGNFESDELFISAEIGGKVIYSIAEEGLSIDQGQLIAIIDTMALHLQKGQLLATKDALRDKLQNIPDQLAVYYEQERVLTKELDRVSKLRENGAATEKQFDDLQGELQVIKKRQKAIESQLSSTNRGILSELKPLGWKIKQVDEKLAKCRIHAPISGTILQRYKQLGELIGVGQPLVKTANLDELQLRVYISSDQLAQFKIGDAVSVFIDNDQGNLDELTGQIVWVSSKAEFTPKTIQTRKERVNQVYAIKVNVINTGSLKIGMPGEIRIK